MDTQTQTEQQEARPAVVSEEIIKAVVEDIERGGATADAILSLLERRMQERRIQNGHHLTETILNHLRALEA